MKLNKLLELFFIGMMIAIFPLTLLADKIDDRYKHASYLLSKGDLQGAQSEFKAILRKESDYKSAKLLLGLTLSKLSEQSEKNGDRPVALAQIHEALRLDAEEAYWHSALARLLHAQGDDEKASRECAQAARLSPDDSELAEGCGFGAPRENKKDGSANSEGRVLPRAGPWCTERDITAPIPDYKPAPGFSDKARNAHYGGTTVLRIVVGDHGEVEGATISKPLGLGLDENALRTIRTWKFSPAIKNGTPVACRVEVEISFRLF